MICPFCIQSDAVRFSYGSYVCDRCDLALSTEYLQAWNDGYNAAKGIPRQTFKAFEQLPPVIIAQERRE